MIRKGLPAMAGAMLATVVTSVSADMSLFGHIDASYIGYDQDGGQDDTVFTCTTCSIGFKGSEDLGNGLKAIFSLDFEYDIFNRNSSSLIDRDQWVGLASSFGQARVGTISTGYKSHGAMIDPLYRTALQGRDRGLQSTLHSGAGEELEGRATNTFRFDSANYNGVKAVAHYTLDSDESDSEDDNPYGIGASYENGALLVFADYMSNGGSDAVDPPGERDAWKVGGKYDLGMFGIMGQYEDYQKSSMDKETVWHVAGTATLFGITAYLGFGKGQVENSNEDYKAWTLAATYNLSKNTMVYFGHSQVDCRVGDPDGAGPETTTLSVCSKVGAQGGEDDRTALGIKHKF